MTDLNALARDAAQKDFETEQAGGEWCNASSWQTEVTEILNRALSLKEWTRFKLEYQKHKGQLAAKKLSDLP